MSKWDRALARKGKVRSKVFKARGPYRKDCTICNSVIPEGRRKFCSRKCSNKSHYRSRIQRLLKISIQEYKIITAAYKVCAICGRNRRLVIDHNHGTLAFRGLLCNPCNTGLGAFGDDPIRLARAIEYLVNNPWEI